MSEHNELGKYGEQLAEAYLSKLGYQIKAKNWQYRKAELDIVAQIDECIVMVEVKTRRLNAVERPQDAVTIGKQKRIIKAADAFIQEHEIDLECRFDVISVIIDFGKHEIEHTKDAFQALVSNKS
jgi:putative endonuclease